MLVHLNKGLFFFFLLGGAILAVSSDSWFSAWCGLELNLMSFIPFMAVKKDMYTSESSLKYFLIQALGSAIIVLGCICIIFIPMMKWVSASALLLKMGAAPMHFWFPSVMSGLSWGSCMVLMSIQKLAPLGLLSYIVGSMENSYMIMVSIVLGAFVGSVGGLNQVFLRKIMAYSSINHMSWMLVAMLVGDRCWTLYYMFYVLVSGSVLYLFYSQQMYHISHMGTYKWSFLSMLTFMCLLSLGGLPPFTGFIPKWFVIQEMMNMSFYFPLFFLLSGTLISLYYYLRLIFMSLTVSSLSLKWGKEFFFSSKKMSLYMYISIVGLFLPSFFFFI
uniref:NADH dehydrogenase subunit 2 n=1 Tax=Neotrypaea harmandi TaxID=2734675 RepID=UPI000A2C0164|nr:NADH dehydrogenase subunit 2 [Neotrypaea harmandi]